MLIPIAVNLDDDDNRVYINRLTSSDIASIPAYDHRPIVRDYERHLLGIFGSEGEAPREMPPSAPLVETPAEMRGDFYADERFSTKASGATGAAAGKTPAISLRPAKRPPTKRPSGGAEGR